MRPLKKTKLVAGLASAAGAAVLAMVSLTAGASGAPNLENPFGPQSTNVPYVAWVGEHVRLVACSEELTEDLKTEVKSNSIGDFGLFFNANFAVEDWSGYQFQPPTPDGDAGSVLGQFFDPGPAAFFFSDEGRVCVGTDYKSLNPGLSRIRLVVKSDFTGEVVFSHQFLAVWMTANKPVLHEAGTTASGTEVFQNALSPTGQDNLARFLGDPSGSGEFAPSPFSGAEEDKGLVQIRVTGSFPVVAGTPLSNILSEPSYTLPSAWKTLAETLSSSQEETEPPGSNPFLWDIHGTPGENPWHGNDEEYPERSVGAEGCETGSPSSVSSTDNCNGGTTEFSRNFENPFALTFGPNATVGPYDPQAGDETLLSDGRLNESDAPMPAMRIDVSIAKNKGGEGELGGVGQISGASKAVIYSHDFNGADNPHNLYNPYYSAFIPATDRGTPQSSGITGPSPGGDFPGFLNEHPEPYEFWTSVLSSNERWSHSTGCLRREGAEPEFYGTPRGPLTETFYTDEEGEAYVTYTPGDAFFFENLPELQEGEAEAPGKVIKNSDGGCDLKLLFGQEIGKSVITARAVYPYEPVDYPAQNSENSLTKTIRSEWEKEFFEFPKGPGSAEKNLKVLVAKAQDIDGNPITWEKVCFHAEGNSGITKFGQSTIKDPKEVLGKGPDPVVGPSDVIDPSDEHTSALCAYTNDDGLAAVVVENSTVGKVDVTVTYTEEQVFRDHFVSFENAGGIAEKEAKEKAEKEAKEKAEKEAKEKAEKEAKEKAEKEAKEKAEKEQKEKEEKEKAGGGVKGAVTGSTSLTGALGGPAGVGVAGVKVTTKPLTEAQKLANALKACKKVPKKKRAACEKAAKAAHSAKHKKK